MRFLVMLLAFLSCLGQARAESIDRFVTGQESDYKYIRDLQERLKSSPELLPLDGAPKAEMVLALAETATKAARSESDNDLKPKDYDALYSLLQKYRDELKAMGLKQTDLENQLVALKQREIELNNKIDSFSKFALDGMKIYGRQSGTFDDVMLTGPGSPATNLKPDKSAFRYRTLSIETSLGFTATRGPISGFAEMDWKNFLGMNYPSATYIGLKKVEFEIRTPLVVQVGDLDVQWTPLTVWRNDDVDPFDVEPFISRHQRLANEVGIVGNAVRIRGVRLLTDLLIADKQTVHLQGFFQALGDAQVIGATGAGSPGSPYYYMGIYSPNIGSYPNLNSELLNGFYSTYFVGWKADTDVFSMAHIGYAGTSIFDSPDSGIATYPAGFEPSAALAGKPVLSYSSQVHSLQASVSFLGDKLELSAEYAESLYSNPNNPQLYNSPSIGHTGFLTGTAETFVAKYNDGTFKVEGNFRKVDSSFISAPAQGRTQDVSTSVYGPFLHETDQYNPQTGVFIDPYQVIPSPGEETFTKAFLPPQLIYHSSVRSFFFNYLMPYNAATNPNQPYGLATPNRMGYGLKGSANLLNGGLIPTALADLSSQISGGFTGDTQTPETYTVYGAGLMLDLDHFVKLPLKLTTGWQSRAIANDAWVNFNVTQINFGGQYQVNKSTLVYAGLKQISYKGELAYPLSGVYTDPVTGNMVAMGKVGLFNVGLNTWTGGISYDESYNIYSLGVVYEITASSDVELNYSTQLYYSALAESLHNPASHYEMDQAYLRFNLRF